MDDEARRTGPEGGPEADRGRGIDGGGRTDLAGAWEALLPHLEPLPPEDVARRAASGRVLAEAVAATVDVPAADVSAMDGYAVAAPLADGDRLPLAGRIAAGDAPGRELPPGAALAVMTGAPVPRGADRVVPFERTERLPPPGGAEEAGGADGGADGSVDWGAKGAAGGGRRADGARVLFHAALAPGANVRRRGEATRAGEPLLPAGTVLGPADLALLATHGHATVRVHRAPRVAFLTTGDEVVPPEAEPRPGQLRDSHTDYLLAAAARLGLALQPLGIVPDRPEALRERLAAGLAAADVLLVGGGVSAGELDFVEGALAALGCRALFTSVSIQPGKPLVAAVREAAEGGEGRKGGRRLVFGLPGNPASVLVTWQLFARPALERLLGRPAAPFDRLLPGELAAPAPGARDRDRFLPARLEHRDGRLLVHPLALAGSHDLAAYARGPALLHVPAGSPPAAAGTPCRVLPEP